MAKKISAQKAVPAKPQNDDSQLLPTTLWHLSLILAVALAAYANTFRVGFHFDDITSIVDNHVIRNLSSFLSGAGYAYNPRRFIGYLSLALNYRLGGLDPVGYHVANLAIHVVNGWLVYLLARLTLKTPFFTKAPLAPATTLIPFLTALLFVAHPVQTQAVTYIVQRLASLATLFYLGALLLYVWARLVQVRDGRARHPKVIALFVLALLSGLAAMTTKEIAVTLPLAAILYDFSFFGKGLKKRYLLLTAAAVSMVVVGIGVIHSDQSLGELLSDINRVTREAQLSRLDYLFTQFSVIVTYLRLLILPVAQNLDYDYPLSTAFFAPRVFSSFLLLAALFGLALYLYASPRFKATRTHDPESSLPAGHGRLIGFGILWFFLTLAIESSVIPITDVIFEHRLYLPSFGAFLAIAAGLSLLLRNAAGSTRGIAAAVLVLMLSAATFQRNTIWSDSITLWRDCAAKSPGKARPHDNLGKSLLLAGELDEAQAETQLAVKLAPGNWEARNNLGAVYEKKGLLPQAIDQYRMAVRNNSNSVTALDNLGAALERQGLLDEAIGCYRKALQLNGDTMVAHNNLGGVLLKKGNTEEAMQQLREAIRIEPDAVAPRNNLAVAYERGGNLDQAIAAYQEVLSLDPNYAEGHNNLGIAYFRKHDFQAAIRSYGEAVRLNPGYTKAYINRGLAYANTRELAKALEQFRQAQRVSPGDKESALLVARTMEFMKQQKL